RKVRRFSGPDEPGKSQTPAHRAPTRRRASQRRPDGPGGGGAGSRVPAPSVKGELSPDPGRPGVRDLGGGWWPVLEDLPWGRPLSPALRRPAGPCESRRTRTNGLLCPPVQRRAFRLQTRPQQPPADRPGSLHDQVEDPGAGGRLCRLADGPEDGEESRPPRVAFLRRPADSHSSATPSITQVGEAVGTILVMRNPAPARRSRNWAAVRSWPPTMTSISRSSSLPTWGPLPGGMTISASRTRPPGPAARRQFLRIVVARVSSQSWTTLFRIQASVPSGTEAKKSPEATRQRSASPSEANRAFAPSLTSGVSKRTPRSDGLAFRMVASK